METTHGFDQYEKHLIDFCGDLYLLTTVPGHLQQFYAATPDGSAIRWFLWDEDEWTNGYHPFYFIDEQGRVWGKHEGPSHTYDVGLLDSVAMRL